MLKVLLVLSLVFLLGESFPVIGTVHTSSGTWTYNTGTNPRQSNFDSAVNTLSNQLGDSINNKFNYYYLY